MKFFRKKFILLCAALLAAALVCLCCLSLLSGRLQAQKAADRWQGDSDQPFRQLSVFLSADDGATLEDIYRFREAMLKKFDEAALETPEGGSLFCDAWSTQTKLKVTSDRTTADVEVIGVGGRFFTFHPMKLLSGSYLTENDLMSDRVVLDKELAWKLFGGYDLTGMTVSINEAPYVIAGVVEREADKASVLSRDDDGGGMFMCFDALGPVNETKATCYEVVMPQPVENFAENILAESFQSGRGVCVTNSDRFSLWRSLRTAARFGMRSMHDYPAAFPYWENAARYYEDWCCLLAVLFLLLLLCPLAAVCILAVRAFRLGRDRAKSALPALAAKTAERVSLRLYSRSGKHMK